MKKIFLILSLLLTSQITLAQVGYVNYSYIYRNLPIAQQYKKKMDETAQQIRSYNLQTNNLAKAQDTPENVAKFRESRKPELYKLERQYVALSNKRDALIQQKVKTASDIIMAEKKLDAILDSRFLITGGIDCTQEVFKAIK